MDKTEVSVTWWEPYFKGEYDSQEGDRGIFRYIILRWPVQGRQPHEDTKFEGKKIWAYTPEHDKLASVLSLMEPTSISRYRKTYTLSLGEVEALIGPKELPGFETVGESQKAVHMKEDGTGFEYHRDDKD